MEQACRALVKTRKVTAKSCVALFWGMAKLAGNFALVLAAQGIREA
jgi:hypothetical protein